MLNSYYQVGGSLNRSQPSYVKRDADSALTDALKEGEFCYVLNSRQMGKSSLRVRAMQELKKDGLRCAPIEITKIGNNFSPEAWYKGFADELLRVLSLSGKVKLKDWWLERDTATPVQRLGLLIEEVLLIDSDRPLAIFIDEIDSTIKLDRIKDDFFAFIRSCYNARVDNDNYEKLTFCLLGVATPSDLIADKTRTPFNIGRAIELTGFTFEEAEEPLIPGLEGKVENPKAVLKKVLNLTGGQPFLTQKLCNLIVNNAEDSNPDIPQLVERYVINNWEGQDDPEHLRTIRDRILRNEQNTSRLLGLYGRVLNSEVSADASPEQMELRLSGLVVKRNSCLAVYNSIYEQIFNRDWIETELDKLRPYSESINGWLKSGRLDKSRLLQGEFLEEALEWGRDKNLSKDDNDFVSASQELDRQEIQKVLEAEQQARDILERANQDAKFLIKNAQEIVGLERASEDALEEFKSSQIQSLLSAMKVGQYLQKMIQVLEEENLITGPILTLQQILTKIKERNTYPHDDSVNSVSFSPEGKMLATASSDKTARLWDLSGNLIAQFVGHTAPVTSVSFSPEGKMLATASSDKTARLWDLSGNQKAKFVGHRDWVRSVSFSPDGKMLATASDDKTARLWDLSGNQKVKFVGHKDEVWSVSFSPEGKMLATASSDKTARLWDLSGSQMAKLVGHTAPVTSVSFSPDGKMLATASNDQTARLWVSGNQMAKFVGHTGWVWSVSFSPDGKVLATASDDSTARLWNLSGNQIAEFVEHRGWVRSVSFSPDGKMLATASDDKTARLWNLSGSQMAKFVGHTAPVTSVSFSPEGKMLATASNDKTARLWDLSGSQMAKLVGHTAPVTSVSFSPDGRMLATASNDRTARLWNLSGKQKAKLVGHRGWVNSVSFSSDGKMLATASDDGTARLWNLSGKQIAEFVEYRGWVNSVSFSPHGEMLATASSEGTVRLWDFSGNQIAEFVGHRGSVNSVSFSPDGKMLATASYDRTASLWNLSGKQIAEFVGHRGSVLSVSFSPDGKMLATASYDRTASLWNLSGKQKAKLVGHTGRVRSVNFSPDGKMLATASYDRTASLWPVENLEELLARGCEWLKYYFGSHPKALEELEVCRRPM
ncbi:MAG: AAA-like domain-containing protein [Cyanobacteriota bacterium]|nr:AAA-like domain-containing protein [Cyanobacteriota bacterium]